MKDITGLIFLGMCCIIFTCIGILAISVTAHFSIIYINSFLVTWQDTKDYFHRQWRLKARFRLLSPKIKLRKFYGKFRNYFSRQRRIS